MAQNQGGKAMTPQFPMAFWINLIAGPELEGLCLAEIIFGSRWFWL